MKLSNKPMIIYFVQLNDEIVYIGQTKLSLQKRRLQHEYNAKRGKGYVIGAGIRKHGAEKFSWNVHSVHYNQVDLDAAEKHYIAKYKPKYNVNLGGEARGVRKNKGNKPWNYSLKGSQTAWNKGRKETRPEVLSNISDAAKGRKTSPRGPATKEANEARQSARINNLRNNRPAFICHQTNKVYTLAVDAARDLDIPVSGIYAVLNPNHRMKSYKNYTFSYI